MVSARISRSLLIVLSLFVLSACSPVQKSNRPEASSPVIVTTSIRPTGAIDVPTTPVNSDWAPSGVKITCASKTCPEGVGVLLYARPNGKLAISLQRCTAFLMASDRIVTNGHCDFSATHSGFFLLRDRDGATVVRRVSGVLHKAYTENLRQKGKTSGRPDVLVLQLESAIVDLRPLQLDTQAPIVYGTLTAYVINEAAGHEGAEYQIEPRACVFRRHEALQPFDPSESPDIFTTFDCTIIGGNSGSPMLGGNGLVQAVLQAGDDPMTSEAPPELNFERHRTAMATSVRCLDFLGGDSSKCIVADQAELERRFTATQQQVIGNLSSLELADALTYATGFAIFPYQLKTAAKSFEYEFEVAYVPNCRRSEGELSQLVYPNRHVKVQFDEWAKPSLVTLEQGLTSATVTRRQGDVFEVQASWKPAFGEYLQPELDPRRQLGERFNVALPVCSR